MLRMDWDDEVVSAELAQLEGHIEDGFKALHSKFSSSEMKQCRSAITLHDSSDTAARSAAAAAAPPGALRAEYEAARRRLQQEGERNTTARTLAFLIQTGDKAAAQKLLHAAQSESVLSQDTCAGIAERVRAMPEPLRQSTTNTSRAKLQTKVGGSKRNAAVHLPGQRTLSFNKVPRTRTAAPPPFKSRGGHQNTQASEGSGYAHHSSVCRSCGCICAGGSTACPLCGCCRLLSGPRASSAVARSYRPSNPWEAAAVAHAVRSEAPQEDENTVSLLDSP